MRTKSGCVFGHLFCGPPKFGVDVLCVYIIINRLKSRHRALPGGAVSAELLPCGSFGGVAAVRGPASEPEPRLFLPETSCPGVLRRRACDPAMRDIYIINCKYLAGEGAVSELFILHGFMSICYNFWVLIFRCLSVVLHSVSACNPWAADARSVLSRWGGCPGALSGRVPKLFGPFCGPTEGCRAF